MTLNIDFSKLQVKKQDPNGVGYGDYEAQRERALQHARQVLQRCVPEYLQPVLNVHPNQLYWDGRLRVSFRRDGNWPVQLNWEAQDNPSLELVPKFSVFLYVHDPDEVFRDPAFQDIIKKDGKFGELYSDGVRRLGFQPGDIDQFFQPNGRIWYGREFDPVLLPSDDLMCVMFRHMASMEERLYQLYQASGHSVGWLRGFVDDLARAGIDPETAAAAGRLIEDVLKDGGLRDLPARGQGQGQGGFNVIPSDMPGRCHNLLVVFCSGQAESRHRMRAAIRHLLVHCFGVTKVVVFAVGDWDETYFEAETRVVLEFLAAQHGVKSFFVTKNGRRLITSRIA